MFNVFFLSVGWGLGAKKRAKSANFAEFDTLYLQICVSLFRYNHSDFQYNKPKTPQNVCAAGI